MIAAEYYGDRSHAVFIIAENKIKDARVKPYERLRIPSTREITTEQGRHVRVARRDVSRRRRRAPFLAEFNECQSTIRSRPARRSRSRFTSRTLPGATESLGADRGAVLRRQQAGRADPRYNILDKNTLEKGDPVLVPVLDVRVRASKLPPRRRDAKTPSRAATKIDGERDERTARGARGMAAGRLRSRARAARAVRRAARIPRQHDRDRGAACCSARRTSHSVTSKGRSPRSSRCSSASRRTAERSTPSRRRSSMRGRRPAATSRTSRSVLHRGVRAHAAARRSASQRVRRSATALAALLTRGRRRRRAMAVRRADAPPLAAEELTVGRARGTSAGTR